MRKKQGPELPVLAVDIGGTKMNAAIISGSGRLLAAERSPTMAEAGVEAVITRLFSVIAGLLEHNNMALDRLSSISLAVAGPIDSRRDVITTSPNLPGWHDVPLADIVRDRFHIDTFLVNDARAATLGEHRYGAGKSIRHMVMLTLGTGIGGGIIINGELYQGASGSAGELGHMVIDINGPACACGNHGCLEAMASGTAVARDAVSRLHRGEKSSLVEMAGGNTGSITAEQVGAAARSGDALALDVLRRTGTYLGAGMSNLVNIFNPEMMVIGGGMAELGDLLLQPARQVVAEKAFPVSAQAVRIVTAQLGNDAGVYGAAVFAREKLVKKLS